MEVGTLESQSIFRKFQKLWKFPLCLQSNCAKGDFYHTWFLGDPDVAPGVKGQQLPTKTHKQSNT